MLVPLVVSKAIMGRALDVSLTRSVLYQLADALVFLYRRDLVHRDIKPENILVQDKDGKIHIALTDLGISRVVIATEQSNLTYIGTTKWMAPEVKGRNPKYGHPADIFGFGLVAVYVKTGDEPEARPEGTEMTGKNVYIKHFKYLIQYLVLNAFSF